MPLKRMSHLFVLPLLALTLLVSGCVGDFGLGQTVSTGNGLSILNFEPEMDSVYSGEAVNFQLRMKNMGSFDITKGDAKILLGEWSCRSSTGTGSLDLIAPSLETGTEGEEKTFIWECTAPSANAGMTIPYDARAEVEYKYKTVTSKTVTLLPTQELITLRNAGKSLPSETVSKSDSPVEVQIDVKGPIRIVEGAGTVEFPAAIRITNVGGGIIKDSKVDLVVEGKGGINTGECSSKSSLALWKGQSQTVTCKMTANKATTLTQARLVATIDYTYIIGTSTPITVIGTKN